MHRGDGGDPRPCITRIPSLASTAGRFPWPLRVFLPESPSAARSQQRVPCTRGVAWGAQPGFPTVSSRGPRSFPIPPVPLSCKQPDQLCAQAGKSIPPRGLVPPLGAQERGRERGHQQWGGGSWRHRALRRGHGLCAVPGHGVCTLPGDTAPSPGHRLASSHHLVGWGLGFVPKHFIFISPLSLVWVMQGQGEEEERETHFSYVIPYCPPSLI